MKTKKGDFVEIVYTGRLDTGAIFDINDKDVAKQESMNPSRLASQTIICLGERDVVSGLDEFLIDKEYNQKLHIDLTPEQGFGMKEPALIQMMPLSKFKEHKINPVPGLQLNIDNMIGIVKSISGGRVLIDFNNPMAGRNVKYDVTIVREVKDLKEKVASFIVQSLKLPRLDVEEKDGIVTAKIKLPKEFQAVIEEQVMKRVSDLKGLKFEE
ncbi:MAG: FKBP-type peptidyl-prolyl cis-trans isomerase [Nanoarchaeota archaeon]|nr:FKBP-type peptidyl-prolyl cis-trans isomerase [Nanoarchaeota archaeon]